MPLHHLAQRHGVAAAGAEIGKALLGEIDVFEIVEMLQDGFAGIIALASPRELGKLIKTVFDFGWKP
jgi:hypothetical protein